MTPPASPVAGPGPGAEATPGRDVPERWPVVGEPRLASGVFVTLRTDQVQMPDGEVAGRDVLEHPGAVAVVALDEADQVLMIRQYRHPVGELLWEIPAGVRDVASEPPRVTAERELGEETGYQARHWHVLTDYYPSPGISSEKVRVFLARGLSAMAPGDSDHIPRHEEAHLLLAWVPLVSVVDNILAGEMHSGLAIVGILSAYAARQGGYGALREADAPQI